MRPIPIQPTFCVCCAMAKLPATSVSMRVFCYHGRIRGRNARDLQSHALPIGAKRRLHTSCAGHPRLIIPQTWMAVTTRAMTPQGSGTERAMAEKADVVLIGVPKKHIIDGLSAPFNLHVIPKDNAEAIIARVAPNVRGAAVTGAPDRMMGDMMAR